MTSYVISLTKTGYDWFLHMIGSYKCKETKKLGEGRRVVRFLSIESHAKRKLNQIHLANKVLDLNIPPGIRQEGL